MENVEGFAKILDFIMTTNEQSGHSPVARVLREILSPTSANNSELQSGEKTVNKNIFYSSITHAICHQ